ncbi:MAG: hypothetical protein KKH49_05840, partial [Candidatus Omnitrophica bacterium]|nr:hypothetical protein [Candidatus Omnitrophota bacterium]
EILAKDYSTFAKWDEKPNPLKRDNINEFIPELVPATFYQNLFLKRKYKVPVVVKDAENKYFVFDGWWFGKKDGYYHGKELSHSDEINVIIRGGNGLKWKQIFSLKNITSNNSRVFSKRPKICKIINKF